MNEAEQAQKRIIDIYLTMNGMEALPAAETERLVKTTNRNIRVAEVVAYLVGLGIYLTGGGVAGSLLGFPFLASGAAVVILRIVLLFDLRVETRALRLQIAQKTLVKAIENARVARSNPASTKDLFPRN